MKANKHRFKVNELGYTYSQVMTTISKNLEADRLKLEALKVEQNNKLKNHENRKINMYLHKY